LKETTPADLGEVEKMCVLDGECKEFFQSCLQFLNPSTFENCITSRTVRSTRLSHTDVQQCLEKNKIALRNNVKEPLAKNQHGVNVFNVYELKQRRRVITESLLNGAIGKKSLPKTKHPSRIEKRQKLTKAKYMFQIDFDAFYDSIPLPENVRECFVFKKGKDFYCLLTLPTGARWSVCVGQSITWVLMNFPHSVTMFSMIDNILTAAEEGEEKEFLKTVRTLCKRIQQANLQTSPPTQNILCMSDEELLNFALQENTFLGETFAWDGNERVVKNSNKTIAKLMVSLPQTVFTFRSFTALVSLVLYATHTVAFNVATLFNLMKAYRGVCSFVAKNNLSWDEKMDFVAPKAMIELERVGKVLLQNDFTKIPPPRKATYDEESYDDIIFIDASAHGWAAIQKKQKTGETKTYQKMWVNQLGKEIQYVENHETKFFTSKHSAYAEPTAILILLKHLLSLNRLGKRIAICTDHFAIVQAQRKTNGYGGIGRGDALNALFSFCHNLDVSFFYIAGPQNPADHASRNFPSTDNESICETNTSVMLPFLHQTFSPLCEEEEEIPHWMR